MTFDSIRARPLPRRSTYPLIGFVLAMGAPAGLLLLRALLSGAFPDLDWIRSEIRAAPITYGYLTVATSVLFAILGRILGAKEDRLEQASLTDPLTRLRNRAHLLARTREEMAEAKRYGHALSFLLIDLDGLKAINDRHGHETGDEALLAVAESLRDTCRATDVPARMGGDEFGVLAPFTSAEEALQLATRIRASLAKKTLRGIPTSSPSVSIGVAELGQSGDAEGLYAAADRALYQAKRAGRDQAILAAAPEKPRAVD